MKVFDTYPGSKGADGTYQTLINYIPPHNVFISGYLGNCAIMRYKLPAPVNVGVDVRLRVINKWKEQRNDIDLFNMNFIEYWRTYGYHFNYKDCFIFIDLPDTLDYYPSLAENLLSVFENMMCNVMVIPNDRDLSNRFSMKWNKIQFTNKHDGMTVIEAAYINYELEGKLHDYRFLGKDFSERQRIKRKIDRHVNKFANLPALERNAIIQKLTTL